MNFDVKDNQVVFNVGEDNLVFSLLDEPIGFETETTQASFKTEEAGIDFVPDLTYSSGSTIPTYAGPYTVTPSQSTQILLTGGFKMSDNVTVNPIPSNYGLITWNGSYLTVS